MWEIEKESGLLSIGHRGAKGYAAENTLLSIRKAIELGADWVEIDVQLVDGRLIVFHDAVLDRTTNGRGPLIDRTFSELRALDAGNGEKIPTLEEVIDLTEGKVGLNIELKGLNTAKPVTDLLADKPKEKFLISSFHMKELAEVNEINNSFRLGVLVGKNIVAGVDFAKALGAYSVHLNKQSVTLNWVLRIHAEGMKVFVYTVNELPDIMCIKALQVDGVFSDFPDRVLQA